MDDKIFKQLAELARAFNNIGIRPVICGGLGIYLSFYNRGKDMSLRSTNDIDLMLTESQVREQTRREAIAEIIIGDLEYVVCEGGKHFQFGKADQQYLDILTQPVEGVEVEGFRAKLVKSCLHGYVTHEACFIEEDLRSMKLSDIFPGDEVYTGLEISVPSLTNQLILKLFAFNDRYKGDRKDYAQAQAHAFDIYVIVTLSGISDYREGQQFMSRHSDSDVMEKARRIVVEAFSSVDGTGWQHVLGAYGFYPHLSLSEKRVRLDEATRRLARWFKVSC